MKFAAVVSVLLTARTAAAAFVIDGLEGPPTANELASLKAGLTVDYRAAPRTCDGPPCGPYNVFLANHHNNYVYGETGGAVEGMVSLYAITKDPAIADSMIFFADQMLAHREEVLPFANTFRYLIMKPEGFAAKVSGTGTGGNVGSTWLYAAFLRHDIFPAVGAALTAAARKGDPDTAGRLLWSKYMNSRNWEPEPRYGDGGTTPQPGDAAAPGSSAPAVDAGTEADPGAAGPPTAGSGGTRSSGGSGGTSTGGAGGSDDEGPTVPPATKANGGGCALGGGGSSAGFAWIVIALFARRRRGARRSPAGLVFTALLVLAGSTTVSCIGTTTEPGPSGEAGTGGDGEGTGGEGAPRGGTRGLTGGTGGAPTGGRSGPPDGSATPDADTVPDAGAPPGDAGGPPPLTDGKFRHPGILVNRGQLALIRDKVKAGEQPWKAAYDRAMGELGSLTRKPTPYAVVECGPYSSPDIGCSPEINDASAAYALAIAWNVTGDEAYARKAIEVMNAWARTLKSHANHNSPLQAGWAGAIWPVAGEIIRHTYSGWAPAEVAAFSGMLKDVYLPVVIKGNGGNGNWELVMIEAAFEIAVFLDDRATFDRALQMWKRRVPAYIYVTSDGPHPPPPPLGGKGTTPEGIKAFWFNIGMYVDGVAQETCRDFGHAEYGLASVIAVAETAFQQGVDLYREHSQRLRAAMELHADYTLGKPAPSWLCGGKLNTRLMPTFEIGYNHYHDRMGMELPRTLELLQSRVRKLEASNKHMVWETLTHAGAGWAGLK